MVVETKNKKVDTERRAKDPVQEAQGTNDKNTRKRSSPARSGDAIKVSAKNGQSYADILKEMKAKVDPRKAGIEVLSIRRTRKEEVHLVLKKGGDVSAFRKELDLAVGERALLQVPWVRPRVPGLQQPRQERRLLEMRRHGTLGQEV